VSGSAVLTALRRSASRTRSMRPFATWHIAFSAGEFVGFGAAASWAFVAFTLFGVDPPTTAGRLGVLGLMMLAGLIGLTSGGDRRAE
jgi:hypothetical protein